MATASTVQLDLGHQPEYARGGITPESSKVASKLLQENHDNYHIFFNADGFHNHIAHHLLTIWALKASPSQLEQAYESNKSYQRKSAPLHQSAIKDLHEPKTFIKYLGPEKHYNDFLEFFQNEIAQTSWQAVLQKYVFAGDERADTMFVRLFSGFLHPIIHLGFGVEFQQPAIIAEALAQAACHDEWIGKLLLPAEQAAKTQGSSQPKGIVELLDEIHADEKLRDAPQWDDGNKIRHGLLARAADQMIHYISQVSISPKDLEQKNAEMTNAVIYYTAGAQRSDKIVKFDFYYIHAVNTTVFFPALLKQDWLSEAAKVRLLEWKIRMDLIMYASRKSPEIHLKDIRNYKPKHASGWDGIQDRVCALTDDDGHAAKLVRAIAHGQQVSIPYEDDAAFRLKQDDWLRLGHMAIDSVEAPGNTWVRSAGFDEAWTDVPSRAQL